MRWTWNKPWYVNQRRFREQGRSRGVRRPALVNVVARGRVLPVLRGQQQCYQIKVRPVCLGPWQVYFYILVFVFWVDLRWSEHFRSASSVFLCFFFNTTKQFFETMTNKRSQFAPLTVRTIVMIQQWSINDRLDVYNYYVVGRCEVFRYVECAGG